MHYLQFHGKEGDDAGRENYFFRQNGCLFVMQWKEENRERAAERLFGLKSKISDFFKFLLYLSDKKKAGKMHPPPFSPPLNNFCLEPFFKKKEERKKGRSNADVFKLLPIFFLQQ